MWLRSISHWHLLLRLTKSISTSSANNSCRNLSVCLTCIGSGQLEPSDAVEVVVDRRSVDWSLVDYIQLASAVVQTVRVEETVAVALAARQHFEELR